MVLVAVFICKNYPFFFKCEILPCGILKMGLISNGLLESSISKINFLLTPVQGAKKPRGIYTKFKQLGYIPRHN